MFHWRCAQWGAHEKFTRGWAPPQVTDATMGVLAGVTTLRALSTGFTKVSDVGVAALARLPSLAALALYAETVTNAALQAAASLHALTSLSLSNCYEARARAAALSPVAAPSRYRFLISGRCAWQRRMLAASVAARADLAPAVLLLRGVWRFCGSPACSQQDGPRLLRCPARQRAAARQRGGPRRAPRGRSPADRRPARAAR
jgi:hypothetical protein